MATFHPAPGFNWMAVSWGGPDEPVSDTCSYCDATIPDDDDDIPLRLWNDDGWAAQFCKTCQVRYWGFQIDDGN
jgi:hypothetical protein